MKTILITGAAGFIGSNLSERLLEAGNRIIGVDNFVTGSRENVDRLKGVSAENGTFEFVEIDVTDDAFWGKFVDEEIDEIYHLACPASPKDFDKMSVEILETCAKGVMNTLKLAAERVSGQAAAGVAAGAKYLFTSTSEVYGDPLESPQKETYLGNVSTLGPRSCYDEGKRFSEAYIAHFSAKNDIDYRIARLFNTYGPYMRKDDGRVIPNFIEELKAERPLTIYGDGSQTRSFCYIDDLLDGLIALMDADLGEVETSGPIGRVFNLGNPNEITINELAETLANVAGKDLNTVQKDLPKDDPKRRCPDISKASEILGFGPKIGLEKGLKKTLEAWN